MRDFRQLEIWKRSHRLTLNIYAVSQSFPKHELFGLTSQLRRATSSVPINIAEGCGRLSSKELARFLVISAGSLSEIDYIILLCYDLKYISEKHYQNLSKEIIEIRKMIFAFHKKLVA